MDAESGSGDLARLEALAEPTRRRLYEYVAGRHDPVGRDQAANDLGLPRHAAKFHLDRLVEAGLLTTEFRRLSGRTGPGAGRPSKLYRRAPGEVSVSVPPRRYALVAEVLADAVERGALAPAAGAGPLPQPLDAAARTAGARLADDRSGDDVVAALTGLGYEPRTDAGRVELANCPYQALAARHTALICGLNAALVEGLVSGLEPAGATARLDPGPGRCCCVVVDLP